MTENQITYMTYGVHNQLHELALLSYEDKKVVQESIEKIRVAVRALDTPYLISNFDICAIGFSLGLDMARFLSLFLRPGNQLVDREKLETAVFLLDEKLAGGARKSLSPMDLDCFSEMVRNFKLR